MTSINLLTNTSTTSLIHTTEGIEVQEDVNHPLKPKGGGGRVGGGAEGEGGKKTKYSGWGWGDWNPGYKHLVLTVNRSLWLRQKLITRSIDLQSNDDSNLRLIRVPTRRMPINYAINFTVNQKVSCNCMPYFRAIGRSTRNLKLYIYLKTWLHFERQWIIISI